MLKDAAMNGGKKTIPVANTWDKISTEGIGRYHPFSRICLKPDKFLSTWRMYYQLKIQTSTEKNQLKVSAISNSLTINFTLKATANIFVQKPQNTKTIFKKEILYKDTSDTHY